MRSIVLPLLLLAALLAGCQGNTGGNTWAQTGSGKTRLSPDGTVSDNFFDDPRMSQALVDLSVTAKARCQSPQSDKLDPCVIDRVAPLVPYTEKLMPFCPTAAETIDRYFCLVMGALGTDLVEKSGAQTADAFLAAHGKDGERVINQAGVTVLKFLSEKCSNQPACGSTEAARRFTVDPADIAACATLGNEWGAVTCLMTSRAVSQLKQARDRI